ncbi:hypothetical protein BHM03_00017845 [Ensete ventricosum]|nr:hypothetical protein BHM03_00017845 [Ensete ventricosum]
MQQLRLKQQQALMQQALLLQQQHQQQQQQSLYPHPGLLAAPQVSSHSPPSTTLCERFGQPIKDAQSAINDLNDDSQENANDDSPENNPQYTTVYVGNLAHEVTQVDLHRYFHALGAGVIEDVRIQRDKGFGFVRYNDHSEAALAIQMGNGRIFCGKPIKCSWGSKPTPPGMASTPLPPPTAAPFPELSATDLLGYDGSLALSKMSGNQALMHAQGQDALKQAAALGMGAGASQAIYDGGFQNVSAGQQFMYY